MNTINCSAQIGRRNFRTIMNRSYSLRTGVVGHDDSRDVGVRCAGIRCAFRIQVSNSRCSAEWRAAHAQFYKCAGCLEVAYCSRECKRLNWIHHRDDCYRYRECKIRMNCPGTKIVNYGPNAHDATCHAHTVATHHASHKCDSDVRWCV